MDEGTLPRLFVAKARQYGSAKVALREKAYGIWQQVTWQRYYEHVSTLRLGLTQLCLQRGDHVAIISGNRPEWLYMELAAQSAGAIAVGLFVDSLEGQVKFILEHSEARFVVVEDHEQVDNVLAVQGELPGLEHILVDDTRGLEEYHQPLLINLGEVRALGRELRAREPHLFDDFLAKGDPADVALLACTSGTTGAPKAAMISHCNLLVRAAGVMQVDPIGDGDKLVSFLPFAWMGEQLLSVAIARSIGATVNFPEKPETLREDMREIAPHLLLAPPRVWETMCSEYQMKIADAGLLKRLAARAALALGYRLAGGNVCFRATIKIPRPRPRYWRGAGCLREVPDCWDEDGHVVMIDRLRDVLRLDDGSRFSLALIENKLKFSPYIRESVIIDEDQPYVVALIEIDMVNVANWAEANRLPFTTFKDLASKAEITRIIAQEVARVNRDLPKVAHIQRFSLFDKELHADDDELTRTQKVRRTMVGLKYAEMIEALYHPRASEGEAAGRLSNWCSCCNYSSPAGGRQCLCLDGPWLRVNFQGFKRGELRPR